MGQVLHRKAKTTHAVRREIQLCKESVAKAAKKYNVNPKTILKWRKRGTVEDAKMGPKKSGLKALTEGEEQMVVAFRQMTLLPLDDVLYALQETIPALTRSNLHRCLQRHGISRLPVTAEKKREIKSFKSYPIGYFHVDIAEVSTEEGKHYLFVAIDRTCKFVYAEIHGSQTKLIAAGFLRNLIVAVPYKINKILTDNGLQFTNHERHIYAFEHIFDHVCRQNGIEHRTTKVRHPWTNGQVERMNKTLKDATIKTFRYQTCEQLKKHLHSYLMAYNFARRLKALKGKTPWEFILEQWKISPQTFIYDPHQFIVGLNI